MPMRQRSVENDGWETRSLLTMGRHRSVFPMRVNVGEKRDPLRGRGV